MYECECSKDRELLEKKSIAGTMEKKSIENDMGISEAEIHLKN